MSNIPTSVRLSDELYNRVKSDSERDKRSITKQIEYMLEQYYKLKEMLNN